MKQINLTRGKIAIVDDEDYPEISKYKWHVRPDSTRTNCWYAARRIVIGNKITSISMHRALLNPPSSLIVDHIDGNGLNNTRENLRLIPPNSFKNIANSRLRKDSRSGFKGVTWHSQGRKWRAGIQSNKKYKSLGLFSDPMNAARAYDSAAVLEYGEFACTNKMLGLIPA